MADPVTIMMVSMAAGSVVKAAGSTYSGQAAASMHKYQAGVAAVNAKIARQNAEYSRGVGEFKAEQSGMKTAGEIGRTTAIQGASGFRVESGSATDVRESQRMLGQSAQNVIRSNAARAAYGHEVEALNFEAQSQMHQMARKTSKIAGFLGAGESLLGGASSVSEKWQQSQAIYG